MNNKEAIEQLKQMPINPEASYEYMKTIYQAIDMAIKAIRIVEVIEDGFKRDSNLMMDYEDWTDVKEKAVDKWQKQ